ncbi:hypothetical protein TcWFU_003765 [Taenia crassiceps]|uniref:Uncharacterized protein n=1 Tax=Taenia crassiceps TaxID=6207 RepID=A0ABR4QQJ6_9CEST
MPLLRHLHLRRSEAMRINLSSWCFAVSSHNRIPKYSTTTGDGEEEEEEEGERDGEQGSMENNVRLACPLASNSHTHRYGVVTEATSPIDGGGGGNSQILDFLFSIGVSSALHVMVCLTKFKLNPTLRCAHYHRCVVLNRPISDASVALWTRRPAPTNICSFSKLCKTRTYTYAEYGGLPICRHDLHFPPVTISILSDDGSEWCEVEVPAVETLIHQLDYRIG